MRIGKVKQNFINDFEKNFYQFDGKQIHKSLKLQIKYQNGPSMIYQSNYYNQSKGLVVLSRVLVALVIMSVLFIAGNLFNKNRQVNVDDLFEAAKIEYSQEPILVSSSYNGEELRIYKGIVIENGIQKVQYYYYFNEIGKLSKVHHLYFVNRDKNINEIIDTKNNFGNLSKLIKISDKDDIEVIIVYENNDTFSQYFSAVE